MTNCTRFGVFMVWPLFAVVLLSFMTVLLILGWVLAPFLTEDFLQRSRTDRS